MTKEEIKQSISMTELVERYGLRPNRAGFIRCPFHQGDHTASLKIYRDSFYCFGCGEGGDIFKFVMLMDNCSFKDAFISLGGEYQKPETKADSRHALRDRLNSDWKRERAEQKKRNKRIRLLQVSRDMDLYRSVMRAYKPFSDEWCTCMCEYSSALEEYECLWEEVSADL